MTCRPSIATSVTLVRDARRQPASDDNPRPGRRSIGETAAMILGRTVWPRFPSERLTRRTGTAAAGARHVHAHHDLHRGPAAGCPPQGAARLFRLRRGRLLFAGDPARQPRGPRTHQAAPARAGRRVATRPHHDHPRREGRAAARARADRAVRHAAWRRRDPRLPRRAGRRHPVHALHHVDLLDRGRGAGGRQAVLVPALRDEGPRIHQGADRACRGGEMQRAGAHASTCRCSASAIATSGTA